MIKLNRIKIKKYSCEDLNDSSNSDNILYLLPIYEHIYTKSNGSHLYEVLIR